MSADIFYIEDTVSDGDIDTHYTPIFHDLKPFYSIEDAKKWEKENGKQIYAMLYKCSDNILIRNMYIDHDESGEWEEWVNVTTDN
jgi:hypothetical protein